MNKWIHYQAFLIPGLDNFDRDEGLRLGLRWLSAPNEGTRPAIVMNAVRMASHAPLLANAAARLPVISPLTRQRRIEFHGPGWILAIWPSEKTIAFAEELAHEGGLCVIPGTDSDAAAWIRARQPEVLGGDSVELPALDLPPKVEETLRRIDEWDGHNDFVGASGKDFAIPRLRELHEAGHKLDPDQIYAWLRANGECSEEGATRLKKWVEEILAGRRHQLRRPI